MFNYNYILIFFGLALGGILFLFPTKPTLKAADVKLDTSKKNTEESIENAVSLMKSENPMQGIQMLKSIVEKDPKNTDALYQLAFFSLQSGQVDKAIDRFNQILAIDSTKTDVLYYLSGIYYEQEKWDLALSTLEKFKNINTDPKISKEIEINISEVKQKINDYAKR